MKDSALGTDHADWDSPRDHLAGPALLASAQRCAVDRGVTLAVIGQTRRSRWYRFRRGSVVERLLDMRAGLDVLVVSASANVERSATDRGISDDSAHTS